MPHKTQNDGQACSGCDVSGLFQVLAQRTASIKIVALINWLLIDFDKAVTSQFEASDLHIDLLWWI